MGERAGCQRRSRYGTVTARSQFGGYYVFTGKGAGQVSINRFNDIAWTVIGGKAVTYNGLTYPGGFNYSQVSNGLYNVTDSGSGWRIIVQRTDHSTTIRVPWLINTTNAGGGGYIRDVHFYRIDDEADFLAGNYFNRQFKQIMIDLNPCAIQFLNRTNAQCWRWIDRTPPAYFSTTEMANLNVLPYGTTSCPVDKVSFVLSAMAETPRSYQHGEIVYCGMSNDLQTPGGTIAGGGAINGVGTRRY